jgi:RNase E specificity factor CsrD
MRYTPTLKLSSRLVAFVTVVVSGTMFILFIGGALSFQRFGQAYLNHYMDGVTKEIDQELNTPHALDSLQQWLPRLLDADSIVELTLSSTAGGVVYQYQNVQTNHEEERLYPIERRLKEHPSYTLHMKVIPPYIDFSYSFHAMGSITLAIGLIIFCLVQSIKWLRAQFLGAELLEERGRMILAGRVEPYAKGDQREWPFTASEALDKLIEELQDARHERSRFDTFIRSQTFLDQLTGAANRVLFDSKLESFLLENGAFGGVLMIKIEEPDTADPENKSEMNTLVIQVGEYISNVIQRYPEVMLSRYYDYVFMVMIPHQSFREISHVAAQCLKSLDRLEPPVSFPRDNWCHIGMTMYIEGENRERIIHEVEIALKTAQMEGSNSWSCFNKTKQLDEARSNVRWRALFERTLTVENLILFKQDCYLFDDFNRKHLVHKELFVRISEEGQKIVKASHFYSAIVAVGFEAVLDRVVCRRVIQLMKEVPEFEDTYSINLYVTPFAQREYFRQFRSMLMQLSAKMRSRLSFEFAEGQLVKHLDYMRPVMKMITAFGCKIIVSQTGRTIVSTHYIKDFKVDYLKLHRSLIRQIAKRHENQLLIRSMLGMCNGTSTRLIAVGVETEEEWQALRSLGINGGQGRLFDAESQLVPKPPPDVLVKPGRRKRWKTRVNQLK